MGVRHLLARVQRLEQSRTPTSPFEREYGSLDAFEAECQSGIDAGLLDPRDMPVVMASIRRWHDVGLWAR